MHDLTIPLVASRQISTDKIHCSATTRRIIAAVLVLTWIVFSSVDILEDLNFQDDPIVHRTFVSHLPVKHQHVKVANDTAEFADNHPFFFGKIPNDIDLELPAYHFSSYGHIDFNLLRTHKDKHVFRI